MATKLRLKFPTVGKKRGDVIEVADKAAADRLIANGTAVKHTEKAEPKKG